MPIDESPLQVSCARGNAYVCTHVCACVYAYGVSTCTCMYIPCTVLSTMWWGDKAEAPNKHGYPPHPLQDWSSRRAETDKSKQVMVSL